MPVHVVHDHFDDNHFSVDENNNITMNMGPPSFAVGYHSLDQGFGAIPTVDTTINISFLAAAAETFTVVVGGVSVDTLSSSIGLNSLLYEIKSDDWSTIGSSASGGAIQYEVQNSNSDIVHDGIFRYDIP